MPFLNRIVHSVVLLCCAGLFVLVLSSSVFGQNSKQNSQCDAQPASALSFVSLPGHPFSIISSKDGCWLFVSLNRSNPRSPNGVALLSRGKGKITLKKVFPVEPGPSGMVLTHDGKTLVVADNDYVVFMDVMRMVTGNGDPVLGSLSDGNSSGSIYVNVTDDDQFVFVSDEKTRSITVINLEKARSQGFNDGAKVGKIPVGNAPVGLTFSPDQKWLYSTSESAPMSFGWPLECKPEGQDPASSKPQFSKGAVIVVNVERAKTDPANSVVARVPAGCSPVRMEISPSGERGYVTARNSNELLTFDTGALRNDPMHALVGTVPVGNAPVGVAVVNEGKLVVVTNSNRFSNDPMARQTLTVIDAARIGEGKAAVSGTIKAGVFPRQFGQSPDGRTLYVTNYGSRELEIIDLAHLPLDNAP